MSAVAAMTADKTYTVRVIAKNGQTWTYAGLLTREAAQEIIEDERAQSIVKDVQLISTYL